MQLRCFQASPSIPPGAPTKHSRQPKGSGGASSSNDNDLDKLVSGAQHSIPPPPASDQTAQDHASVSETELGNLLLHEIAEMDRRPSGPLVFYNHKSQPLLPAPTTTTTHAIVAAHIPPAQSRPTLPVPASAAHPVPHPHLYKVLDYAIYPFCPPPHRRVSAATLAAQRQQAPALAAAKAWVHGGVAKDNNTVVDVGAASIGGDVGAVAILGAAESAAAMMTTQSLLATKKKQNRNPRGPYKKHQRDDSAGSTAATPTTADNDNEDSGEPVVKKRRHGGGRSKGVVLCSLCGIVFARPFTLRRHVDNIHAESVVCACGVRFAGEEEVGVHLEGGGCAGV
ncbi:uncharacterized protein H6S33_008104 [Morchella sextelata]|uniref:uncharacterized protein n=1 Tax=Morchella sextelata TaxID=1174677 RepID=UPI001D03BFFE|nr:uncharacterized protein H6S33_008104 [Morchella sextelata]KAH0603100.1 hypothetical protein H6S33_008104 [Morchella sextelata]